MATAQRYLLFHEYLGTSFAGWQRQRDKRTVQGTLEEAIAKFMATEGVSVTGSSRTDSGVHAALNSCHVDLTRVSKQGKEVAPHDPDVVTRGVNHFLSKLGNDVRLVKCLAVPPDFHARHRASARTYHYRILTGVQPPSVFEQRTVWHIKEHLDVMEMSKAASMLEGDHDFSSFRASGCVSKSPQRTLDELSVRVTDGGGQWDPSSSTPSLSATRQCILITARARSFLYHQVRMMVGVLKAVGTGHVQPSAIPGILNKRSPTALPCKMAAPSGLFLARVHYDGAGVDEP